MFHVKQAGPGRLSPSRPFHYHDDVKAPRALIAAPLLLLFLAATSACVSTENPQGWAAPVFDGSTTLFLQSHTRVGAAPVPGDTPSTTMAWSFPDKNSADQKGISFKAVYGEPVVDGGRIYLTTYDGGVFALDQATGKPIWRVKGSDLSGNIVGGAAVGADVVVFGTTDGHVYAVKKADGSTADGWPRGGVDAGAGVWAAPVIKDGAVFVATMAGDLRAWNLADHAEKWKFKASGAIANFELLADGRLFVPSLNKHVYFVDSVSGAQKGEFQASDWVWTQPAVKDGVAYFGDFGGNVYALNIKGDAPVELWRYSTGSNRVKSGPAIVGDVVVIADRQPMVHFVGAKDGKLLNKVPIQGSGTVRADLAVKDGFVYISTTAGGLFRADPGTRSVTEITVSGRQ
jgi:outer membrane protein assembly factor BamB